MRNSILFGCRDGTLKIKSPAAHATGFFCLFSDNNPLLKGITICRVEIASQNLRKRFSGREKSSICRDMISRGETQQI